SGELTLGLSAPADGWVAARLSSQVRDSFFQPVSPHTSPVYIQTGRPALEQPTAAAFFERALDTALEWVDQKGRFHTDAQRRAVAMLFKEGQAVYRSLRAG